MERRYFLASLPGRSLLLFPPIFFLLFLAFSRCLRTYFQLLCCASIRFRASPKHTLGRSDFARLVENDLLIAEKTSSAGVLGVLRSRVFSFIGVEEDSYDRQRIRSVERVFRPSGIKTKIWEGGRRVTVPYTSTSGSSEGAMFSRGLSRNVARLSTTNPAPIAQEYNFVSRDTGVE